MQYFRVIGTLHWDLISNVGVTRKGLYLPSSVIHYYKSQTEFSKGHYLSMHRILICNFIFKFIIDVVLSFKSNKVNVLKIKVLDMAVFSDVSKNAPTSKVTFATIGIHLS